MALLVRLQELALVNGPPWGFTEFGQARLLSGEWVSSMCAAFPSVDNISLDSSILQLLFCLLQHGWELIVVGTHNKAT